jgi:cell division septation protein DedD
MLTIRPSVEDNAPPPEAGAAAEDHQKRLPLVWIPATLGIGLLIAAIYLGGRIVAGHGVVRGAIPAIVKETEVEEAAPPAPPKFASLEPLTAVALDNDNDGIPTITPKGGELYIQLSALNVGALNQEATRRFARRLRNDHLEPHVAPGPTPELMRILIGPFDNRDTLRQTQARLETEGLTAFVRKY